MFPAGVLPERSTIGQQRGALEQEADMAKSDGWRRKRAEQKQRRREEKRRRSEDRRDAESRHEDDAEVHMRSLAREWCGVTVLELRDEYARQRGMQPCLRALVPTADGLRDCQLNLEHTEGVEVLRADLHPWPNAVATVFARGFHGDFLAVFGWGESLRLKLIDCGGMGIHEFAEREPELADFEGPLPSDERVLDAQRRIRSSELVRAGDRIRREGRCLFASANGRCGQPAIDSHSVGRAAHLHRIAEDGHVLGLSRRTMSFFLGSNERIGRIGVGSASTFRGFCGPHDSELFQGIDTSPIEMTQRNVELLGYRAHAYEYFVQWVGIRMFQEELGLPEPEELLKEPEILRVPIRRRLLGWRDCTREKQEWDDVIAGTGAKRGVRYHVIRFQPAPEILAAAYVCPDVAFDGSRLQDLDSLGPAEYVAVALLQDGDTGILAVVWLEGASGVGERLAASLDVLPETVRMDVVVRWLVAHAENIYWSPEWWAALDPAARLELERLIEVGVVPWAAPLSVSSLVQWRMTAEVRGWSGARGLQSET